MRIANIALNGMNKYELRLSNWLLDRCGDGRRRPDIVTLQKIGSSEPFPKEKFRKIGYESWFLDHKRNYRGVAILAHRYFLSRLDLQSAKELHCGLPGADQNEARFLTVRIGNLSISSIYAPVSKSTIAPTVRWLNRLREHVRIEGYARRKSVLCGDFNVPRIDDESKGMRKDALDGLLRLGFDDLFRKAHPCATDNPGWTWGYREGDCTKGTSRLHLILASKCLTQCLRSACVDAKSKPWPRPDAPPLIAELDVEL